VCWHVLSNKRVCYSKIQTRRRVAVRCAVVRIVTWWELDQSTSVFDNHTIYFQSSQLLTAKGKCFIWFLCFSGVLLCFNNTTQNTRASGFVQTIFLLLKKCNCFKRDAENNRSVNDIAKSLIFSITIHDRFRWKIWQRRSLVTLSPWRHEDWIAV
jgi:hypothetical protein